MSQRGGSADAKDHSPSQGDEEEAVAGVSAEGDDEGGHEAALEVGGHATKVRRLLQGGMTDVEG